MQKVIFDTNVLISALIQKSYPFLILNSIILENKSDVCISEELYEEYLDVIHRPKFSKYPDFLNNAELILTKLNELAIMYYPLTKVEVLKDKNDNKILELALESSADYIITGNTKDFTLKEFHGTKIISPKEFWELYSL
jgi:hypothetical protein